MSKKTAKKPAKKTAKKTPTKKRRSTKRKRQATRMSLYRDDVSEVRLVAVAPIAVCEKKLNELLADGWVLLHPPHEGCEHYVFGK